VLIDKVSVSDELAILLLVSRVERFLLFAFEVPRL